MSLLVSQWDEALECVERVTMETIDNFDGNVFDPRRSCAATVAALGSDQVLDALVRKSRGRVPREYFAIHLPGLVEEIVADRRRVMASTRMCEIRPVRMEFGVQHCESRIVVHAYVDDGFVSSVTAKPYDERVCGHGVVPGPAWLRADAPNWSHRYVLLGIGARVYGRAAELVPQARWKQGPLSPFSTKLRAKLHRGEPWRWQFKGCEVCRGVVDWEQAGEGDFPAH